MQDFDPAPFRRVTRLRQLLEAALSGRDVDPDVGCSLEEREVRAETRRLVAESLSEAPTPAEEDAIIVQCWKRATRTMQRKSKRHAAGGEWAEDGERHQAG